MPNDPRPALIPRPWIRVLAWTLAATAIVEVTWIVLAGWSIRSGWLLALANRRPDKVRVEAASIRSYWPGMLEVRGLRIVGQTPRVDWEVRVDHARAGISLPELLTRRFELVTGEARGVDVVSVVRTPPRAPTGAMKTHSSLPTPTAPSVPPAAGTKVHAHWSFGFHNLRIDGLRSVTIDDTVLRGHGQGRGGFAVDARAGRAVVDPSHLDLTEVEVLRSGQQLGRRIAGSVDLRMLSWPYAEKHGRDLVPYASGRIRLDGELDDRPLLEELLRRAPWVRIEPALSTVSADLRFERGALRGPGKLVARRPVTRASVLDFAITGRNELDLTVDDHLASGTTADWLLRFADFSVGSAGIADPLLVGSGMVLSGHLDEPRLGETGGRTDLQLDLGQARLPDLSRLSYWLPTSTRLSLLGGAATVSGVVRLRLPDRALSGEIRSLVEDARLRWSAVELDGRIDATLVLAGADLERRSFDISGSHALLKDFRSPELDAGHRPGTKGWWANLYLQDARLLLAPRLGIDAGFHARLRDTAPLVGLFELRRDLPDWATRALTVENVEARGRFDASPGRLDLANLESSVYGGTLRARAVFEEARRRGRLLLAWRRLAVAAGFEGNDHTVKVVGARDWYSQFEP